MKDIWGPIYPAHWHNTPVTSGRCATEVDVKAGRAVFYVDGGPEPAEIELPCAAIQHLENGTQQRVVVIQAERVSSGVALGVRPLEGGNCVCMEHEVELLKEFTEWPLLN